MYSQMDGFLTKAFSPKVSIYKPSKGHTMSFVFLKISFLSVTTNYSRLESKKITENPTN